MGSTRRKCQAQQSYAARLSLPTAELGQSRTVRSAVDFRPRQLSDVRGDPPCLVARHENQLSAALLPPICTASAVAVTSTAAVLLPLTRKRDRHSFTASRSKASISCAHASASYPLHPPPHPHLVRRRAPRTSSRVIGSPYDTLRGRGSRGHLAGAVGSPREGLKLGNSLSGASGISILSLDNAGCRYCAPVLPPVRLSSLEVYGSKGRCA